MQGSGLLHGLADCDIWSEKQVKGHPQPYRVGIEHSQARLFLLYVIGMFYTWVIQQKGDEKNITRGIKTKEKEILVNNMDDLLSVCVLERLCNMQLDDSWVTLV